MLVQFLLHLFCCSLCSFDCVLYFFLGGLVLTVVKVLELPDSLEAAQAAQGPRPLSSPGSWVSTNTSEQTLSLSPKGGLFEGRLNVSPPPPAPTCSCFPHGPPMGATYFLTRGRDVAALQTGRQDH